MAQIDLRHADFYIKDGYTQAGTINQPGGYASGTTTIAVTDFNIAIPNGSTFQINGTGTTYTISSTTGGSTPASITFSSAFSGQVADGASVDVSISGLTVNNSGGYSSGASTMNVTGLSEAIPDGTPFQVAGDATNYTVTGSTGGSTPTAITFTPTLNSSPTDDTQITLLPVGAINSPTDSPQQGDTSIIVTGFSSAVPEGAIFKISGDTTQYTITAVTGNPTPTAFTFTPALTQSESNGNTITVGPNILTLKIGEGNVTFEEKRDIVYVREKQQVALGFVKTGDDQPMDVSIDLIWEFLSGTSDQPPYPEEAFTQTGQAVDWVTSGADPCEPYAVNVEIVYTPPCSGVEAEVILLEEFRWESINHDSKAGTMSVKGKCKILQAQPSRVDQPVTP